MAKRDTIFGEMLSNDYKKALVYYNFPVSFLGNLLYEPPETFNLIMAWATYDYIKSHAETNSLGCAESLQGKTGWKMIEPAMEALRYRKEGVDLYQWYKYCGEIYSSNKGARTGLSHNDYWEFANRFNSMPIKTKVVWLAFLAAKSILGNVNYCKTNDLMLFARMNGRQKAFQDECELEQNSHPDIASFYTRRKRETIRRELADKFHINTYSFHDRGYFISRNLSLKKLIEVVESNRETTVKQHKNEVAETRAIVLAALGKKPP